MPRRPLRIDYPPDVADPERLRNWLADTDVFGSAQAEADAYLADSLERFRITVATVPPLGREARVLELGANPYFLTRILRRRGLKVVCANWFGLEHTNAANGRQIVQAPTSGEEEVFDFDHFNAEKETFPYEDEAFDLVLCCEILEHLPEDPVNLLAESHRVLRKPSGRLLLTTPNPVRTDNLIRLIRGRNVYEQISGYGVYGRHNREYTIEELGDLLTQCGYEVTSLFAADTQPGSERLARLTRLARGTRQDRLFALARPLGEPRWRYPAWLYASTHALRRVVRPDLVMGVNDDLQSFGFRELVELHGRCVRWIGEDAATTVVVSSSPVEKAALYVAGVAPPEQVGESLRLTAEVAGDSASWTIPSDGAAFSLTATVAVGPGEHEVRLAVEPTWRPDRVGVSADSRALGVAIERVAISGGLAGP